MSQLCPVIAGIVGPAGAPGAPGAVGPAGPTGASGYAPIVGPFNITDFRIDPFYPIYNPNFMNLTFDANGLMTIATNSAAYVSVSSDCFTGVVSRKMVMPSVNGVIEMEYELDNVDFHTVGGIAATEKFVLGLGLMSGASIGGMWKLRFDSGHPRGVFVSHNSSVAGAGTIPGDWGGGYMSPEILVTDVGACIIKNKYIAFKHPGAAPANLTMFDIRDDIGGVSQYSYNGGALTNPVAGSDGYIQGAPGSAGLYPGLRIAFGWWLAHSLITRVGYTARFNRFTLTEGYMI